MNLNRTKQPLPKPVQGLKPPKPELRHLSNGMPAYVLEAGDQDITRVDIILQAGTRYQKNKFQSLFTNSLLTEGTKSRPAKEIAGRLDFYGSYINPACDRDEAFIQVYSLDKFLPATMDIAADIIMNPVFDEKELNIYRQRKIQSLAIEDQKVDARARKSFIKNAFGENHPYGQIGDSGDMAAIDRSDLIDFHGLYYNPAYASVIISGKNAGSFLALVDEKLGKWEGTGEPGILFPTGPAQAQESHVFREEMPGSVQSAIRIGCIMPDIRHEDFAGLSLINTLLGGYFGSRLMQNIREDKGYTYGIGSSLRSFKEGGIFVIASEVNAQFCGDAIKECFNEIERICSEAVPESELSRVRQYIEGELLRQVDGPFNLADMFRYLLGFGLDFSYLNYYINVLYSLGPEELQKLAGKYFRNRQFIQVIAGDPGK